MTKTELIAKVAEVTGTTKKATAEILDVINTVIVDTLVSGDDVATGIGKFIVSEKEASVARNPKTGESINIPAHNVVKYSVLPSVKKAVR